MPGSSRAATDKARAPADLLREARSRERAGHLAEAIAGYESAIARAEATGDRAVLSEALRRLGVLHHQRNQRERARELCRRSLTVAREMGGDLQAAEALNTLGVMDLKAGSLGDARAALTGALELGARSLALRARVEQNLGILANIQGELEEAIARYGASLDAYRRAEDLHGCALAYHNLGMVRADQERFDEAEACFQKSRELAERTGDRHLVGLCLLNHAEVDVARQRFENARQDAEAALALFDQLEALGPKSETYRVIGMVYRETGRPVLAEARLRRAIDLAAESGSALNEAEACRELAVLYQGLGRNRETLTLLNAAYRLFRQVNAQADLVRVGGRAAALEASYIALVRAWGSSIEMSDPETFGHCERVAGDAVAVGRLLGLEEREERTLLLGAYLHDLGQVRIPPRILSKPGALSAAEIALLRMHPIWGVELLGDVELPWDIKPIIRWHHERYDGSGYPDHLVGDAIPVAAQIVGILETYDALTTPRAYRAALPAEQAVTRITACRGWWSERVFEAFVEMVGRRQDGRTEG